MSGRTRGLLHWEADDGPIDPMTFKSPGYWGNARLVDSSGENVLDAGGGEYQPYAKPEDAERLALCWNALEGLDGDTVRRLGAWLAKYNNDELRQMLDEEGA